MGYEPPDETTGGAYDGVGAVACGVGATGAASACTETSGAAGATVSGRTRLALRFAGLPTTVFFA